MVNCRKGSCNLQLGSQYPGWKLRSNLVLFCIGIVILSHANIESKLNSFVSAVKIVVRSVPYRQSPYGRLGLAALGGAVVDRTFFRPQYGYGGTNNYYYNYPSSYSYPGYSYSSYYYGRKK
uniref:Uncharacterized protein n=1 Tax=Caenorhabditis japonica TaxID=281687 RepID=A0A8R1DU15_CAEJA